MYSSYPVMFFLLHRLKDIDKIKYKFRREITEITSSLNSRVRLWKINHWVPGCNFYEFYEGYIYQQNTRVSIISRISATELGAVSGQTDSVLQG